MAYVYGHYKADTNELFYIGKGSGKRAWDKQKRNRYWKSVANKHGLIVKILEDNLSEEDAFEKEKQLIAEVGIANLTNILEGGEGITSKEAVALAKNPNWITKQRENTRAATSENLEWLVQNAEKNRRIASNPARNKKMAETLRNKPDVKERMSVISKKRWSAMTPEQRATEAIRLRKISKNRSPESISRISIALKGKPKTKVQCVTCGKYVDKANLAKYHKHTQL